MNFAFTEDQLQLRDAVVDVLSGECTPEKVRAAWTSADQTLWPMLAELGMLGINAPEDAGGLGMGPMEWVLVLEETGRYAAPIALAETIALIPALVEAGDTEAVEGIATGAHRVTVGPADGYVLDADLADAAYLVDGDTLYLADKANWTRQHSVDGARRLFGMESATLTEIDADGAAVFDRAALATAAQLVGVSRNLLDTAVGYAKERRQFGKAIGSFQAVQHQLVDARLKLEFAAPMVYRASHSLGTDDPDASLHVSMAKAMASDAGWQAARTALQVHGAIGYTFEYDLHLWMKRAFALSRAWGDARWHRNRVGDNVLPGESDA